MKIKVSYFRNVRDTSPKTIKLKGWLKDTINPPEKLKQKVQKYRTLRTDSAKQAIPCITVSAVLGEYRELTKVKVKTGLICLDIDPADNPVIDMEKVKQLFLQHPSCLYVGRSVSNNGIYAIMVIDPKVKLIKYFKYFKKQLKNKGIIIDEKCKDYTRLRFFSYDPDAYLNLKAKCFNIPKKKKVKYKGNTATSNDRDKVESVVSLIEQHSVDITQDYNDWVKVAGALYNAFGGSGLDYFHRVSRFYPKYNKRKTDKKFQNCMNMKHVKLSSFFYVASKHGIRY